MQLLTHPADAVILGEADLGLSLPLGHVIAGSARDERHQLDVGVLPAKLLPVHLLSDDAPLGVRPRRIYRCGIHVDREWIPDRLDDQFLVEGSLVRPLAVYAPIAPAHADSGLTSGVVGDRGVGARLNVPDRPTDYVGDVLGRPITYGVHLDARALQPHVVDDTLHERVRVVDRQARPLVDPALVVEVVGPLLAVAELERIDSRLPVVALRLHGDLEARAALLEDLLVAHGGGV